MQSGQTKSLIIRITNPVSAHRIPAKVTVSTGRREPQGQARQICLTPTDRYPGFQAQQLCKLLLTKD